MHDSMGFALWGLIGGIIRVIGSNSNRETVKNLNKAGIHMYSIEEYSGKIVKLIVASPV
ncbi:hypothetical protein SPSIL_006380 [Sporomusa silvacetica DSM 10669]|uniref:Dinitrogenase iron-molybdenum cofactor biosynthesis domain-containing protein n=1 Tax=Sporomusa silvacetica DSM 10669 TaxID=1123289 RepID=A0ABZ3IFS3_9FIRM|nr:hypothetical protein SPSIL_34010 [Sporomusa silvacetica DSM 10669]